MGALRVLTRSLSSSYLRSSKPYLSPNHPLLSFTTVCRQRNNINQWQHQHQHQNRRNLILESSASEFVKLHKLSGTDSGIVEVSLDKPGAKNAFRKEMLRGLNDAFELINQDSYAKVAMICSSVPRVFCAGADLKERRMMNQSEVKAL